MILKFFSNSRGGILIAGINLRSMPPPTPPGYRLIGRNYGANMQSQAAVMGWPALLTLEHACRYLSLDGPEYISLVTRWGVSPVEIDSDKIMWRLSDLNSLLKRLPAAKGALERLRQPRLVHFDAATIALLADAIATRLHLDGGLPAQNKPRLIAIKEACRQLGLGRTKVNQMIDEGVLQVQRIGRRKLVTQKSIQALLDG